MPKMTLSTENKATSPLDYPKLKLKYDEAARIVLLEEEFTFEYVHTLRAPKLEDGKPVYKKRKDKQGNETEELEFNFVGRHICLGNIDVLLSEGKDPKNCPACNASLSSEAVRAPERRMAIHVFQYSTARMDGFKIAEPFGGKLVAWVIADQTYNKLADIKEEWGDMRMRDLNLGPCTQELFQKFEIVPANSCEWLVDDARKAYVKDTLTNNRCPDLSALIGRTTAPDKLMSDVNECISKHRVAFSNEQAPALPDLTMPATSVSLDDVLGGLDDDTPVPAPVAAAPDPEPAPSSPQPSPEPVQTLPDELTVEEAATAPEPETVKAGSASFDDILAGLG